MVQEGERNTTKRDEICVENRLTGSKFVIRMIL